MGEAMWVDDLGPHGVELRFDVDRALIRLRGQVDVATGVALVDAATSAVARYEVIHLDLAGVTWIDDVGVRSLVKVRRFADAHGAEVVLVEVSEHARGVIHEAGVADWLGVTAGS